MSARVPVLAVLLLLAAAACSPASTGSGGTPTPGASEMAPASVAARVEPQDVVDRLLGQLRDEDYAAAHETLSTGQARSYAANELDLMTKMMSASTDVQEWSLDEPTFVTVDEQSKVQVDGTVTFGDGGSGRVRVVLQALGLQADPWRVDEFELTRDEPVGGDDPSPGMASPSSSGRS